MMIPRHPKAAACLALAALIACSACGSSGPPPPTLRQKVDTIIVTTDAALARDRKAQDPPLIYSKFSMDFEKAAQRFKALTFPRAMRANARALVSALELLSADSSTLSKAEALPQSVLKNVQAEGQATLKLTEAEEAEKKASNAVRADVGLPEETTTTTTTPTLKPTTTTAPATTTTKG